MLSTYLFHVWLFLIRTKRSGDTEQNPGPKSNSSLINLMMFACQKLLNVTISNDDNSLEVPGYNLFRADHPSNIKREGLCIYYRNSLLLNILGILYLQECINFEITIGGRLCRLISLYHSPNRRIMILHHLL